MKLLVFTACTKVLSDPIAGTSLISMFQEMNAVVPTETALPKDAVLPKEWAVFTLWSLEPEEIAKPYSMKFELRWPNGDLFTQNTVPLNAKPGDMAEYNTYTVNMMGLPMGQDGKLKVTVWVELDGKAVTDQFDLFVGTKIVHDISKLGQQGQI
jgi:hypothetical protein